LSKSVEPLAGLGIDTLPEVLDPAVLTKHLHVLSHAPWNGGVVEDIQVRVLRQHVGQRCTLEIGLRTEKGWHFVIGKVYQIDCPDVFQAMEGIRQAGFGPQDEFSIPQPLAYLPSLRLHVQEKVEGPSAGDIFKTGFKQNQAAAAERCALWLARFHAIAPKAGPVSYPHEHLQTKSMQRCSRKMTKRDGPFAGKAARLFRYLEDASSSLRPVELRAGHGSFSAAHVILARGRTVAIDWDFHDVADPARDVARFLAALRRRALIRLGSARLLDETAEAFLKNYLAAGPRDAKQNLRFFEAATYLNLAARHLDDDIPQSQENTETMLEEGFRALKREVA
jgi:aminoglycoside phosphotransferase (APT) family kinase protein